MKHVANLSGVIVFHFIIYMPAPIIHKCLWPTVGRLVRTNAKRWGLTGSKLLVYRSAIYPQGMTSKYSLGGRL